MGETTGGDFWVNSNQFQVNEQIKVYSASGRFVGYAFSFPKQEQTDITPTIPESTQAREDPDEKRLSDLNKGNMPRIAERKLHLIRGTREDFNSSMQNNLDYLDGLIKGDGQDPKLNDSAASSFNEKINTLKQEIQNNPKMGRYKVYKEYKNLKQEIQNQRCCDKVLNDLKLDKSNLSNGVQQVYNKALSSKEPVDAEKFKKAAIKAHNKDVVDGIKKEIDKNSGYTGAQKRARKDFVSRFQKQGNPFNKDELTQLLDSSFNGVGAEGIADSFAVDENTNDDTGKNQKIDDDDNTDALFNAVDDKSKNDEFNAGENPLLNRAGASENNDVFIQNMNDGFGDDNEVRDDVQPETTPNKGIPGHGASAVDAEEQVKNMDKPGAEETTNPEDTGAAEATDNKGKVGTVEDPFANDFEEDFTDNGGGFEMNQQEYNNFGTDDDTSAAQEREDFQENSWENVNYTGDAEEQVENTDKSGAKETTNLKNNDNELKAEKQKGQRQEEFIAAALAKALEGFDKNFKSKSLQPDSPESVLRSVLEDKLKGLKGKHHGLAFNARVNRVISRAKKLQTKFVELDQLQKDGKIGDIECNNYKGSLTQLFRDTKSGPTHSAKFNAEVNKTFAEVKNAMNAREKAANGAIVNLVKENGDYEILQNSELFKNVKETFLQDMIEKNAKEVSDYGRGLANNLLDRLNVGSEGIIADTSVRNSLDKHLGDLLQKYGNDEKEFIARAQGMIARAKEMDYMLSGNNLSDENKKRFLDLLNMKTDKKYDSKFKARLTSLAKEISNKGGGILHQNLF